MLFSTLLNWTQLRDMHEYALRSRSTQRNSRREARAAIRVLRSATESDWHHRRIRAGAVGAVHEGRYAARVAGLYHRHVSTITIEMHGKESAEASACMVACEFEKDHLLDADGN